MNHHQFEQLQAESLHAQLTPPSSDKVKFSHGLASPVSPNGYLSSLDKLDFKPQPSLILPLRTMNLSQVVANAPQSAHVSGQQNEMFWGPMSAPLSNGSMTNFFANLMDVNLDHTNLHLAQYTSDHFQAANILPTSSFPQETKPVEAPTRNSKRHNNRSKPYGRPDASHESLPSLTFSSSQEDVSVTQSGNPDRPFLCPYPECGKSFAKLFNLRSHIRIHTTDKNFHCVECNLSFRRPHDLQRHIRSIHSTEKPFACSTCSKAFARSDALKRHQSRVTSACYMAQNETSGSPQPQHHSEESMRESILQPQTFQETSFSNATSDLHNNSFSEFVYDGVPFQAFDSIPHHTYVADYN